MKPSNPDHISPREPLDWDTVFQMMAIASSQRSKDPSTQCGAVLVGKDRVVLATGFNGPPSQLDDLQIPWGQRPEKYAYILHAEENALWFATSSYGFDRIKGSVMYCTHAPCTECVLRMIRCGVSTCRYPATAPKYPMSKYQVDPTSIVEIQAYPKLSIEQIGG